MNRKNDPYYDTVYYHKARKIHPDGGVSALCYKSDRKIRLGEGWSWTILNGQVTCPKCLKILEKWE